MKLIKINENVSINPEYIQYIEVVLPDKNSLNEALKKFGVDYLVEFGVPLIEEFTRQDYKSHFTVSDGHMNYYSFTGRKSIGNEKLVYVGHDYAVCKLERDYTKCFFLPEENKGKCLFIRVKLQDKEFNIPFKDADNFLAMLEKEGLAESAQHAHMNSDDFIWTYMGKKLL